MRNSWEKDPYLYKDAPVLRNIPGVKTSEELKAMEGDLTKITMNIAYSREYARFNTDTLRDIHKTIFGPLYDWAGEFRTIHIMKTEEVLGGDSVRYASPSEIKKQLDAASSEVSKLRYTDDPKTLMFKIVRITASIWHTHPFREGNTRAAVVFSVLLAARFGIRMDYAMLEKHAAYVRNALVWCTQGIYSQFQYLERIYYDAAGLLEEMLEMTTSGEKDYSALGSYKISGYKERPHIYAEEE